jgi:hypothetical protein
MASKRPQTGSPEANGVSDSFAAYKEYNSALRTWFLTFGVGCLAALVSDKDLRTTLHGHGNLRLVAALLICGVACQIAVAIINKYMNWAVYRAHVNPKHAGTRTTVIAEWLCDQVWIDFLLDALTLILFVGTIGLIATAIA